MISIVVKI